MTAGAQGRTRKWISSNSSAACAVRDGQRRRWLNWAAGDCETRNHDKEKNQEPSQYALTVPGEDAPDEMQFNAF